MKMFSFVLASLVATSAAFAGEETRTDKTSNTIVVVVGTCSVSKKIDPISNEEVYESTLPATNCQEYKTYRANVTGKFWNQKVTPIEGTETYSYKLVDDTQIGTSFSAADPMGYFHALNSCNEKRNLLVQLAEARRGQAKCKL